MRTEIQIERIARREDQATTAQDRVELTEAELTHLVGGSIGLGSGDPEDSAKATPILFGSGGSEVDLKSVPILM